MISKTTKWRRHDISSERVSALQKELNISKILAQILVNRKNDSVELAQRFLNVDLSYLHDPFLMQDMKKCCDRLVQSIYAQQKICIYGDYDVDGSVATALLLLFLKELGCEASFYIPCRQKEGYSLNATALKKLKESGVDLIVTVDNGTMAHSAVDYANQIGLDVIITDHHKVGETLPQAYAVVNPQRHDCAYPFKGLCGAGVAFKLLMALRQTLRHEGYFQNRVEPHLKSYFDLVCLSTICDVVPLIDENRLFVKEGLKALQHTTRLGLRALKAVCAIDRSEVTVSDVGFKMGPRLNAAGRLDDASHGVRLLISQNIHEAKGYAEELDRLNSERREIESQILDEAMSMVSAKTELPRGLVVFSPDWHVGVVGIVASRLVEKWHRPVFVLCQTESGEVKGSGRSYGNVNLVKALEACAPLLSKYGGHEAAAGVTLELCNLELFQKQFAEAVELIWPQGLVSGRDLCVDAILNGDEMNCSLMDDLEKLAPFGMGNPSPLFLAEDLSVVSKNIVAEKHLKLKLRGNSNLVDAIAFQKAGEFSLITDKVSPFFHLERHHFRGQDSLQLVVREFLNS